MKKINQKLILKIIFILIVITILGNNRIYAYDYKGVPDTSVIAEEQQFVDSMKEKYTNDSNASIEKLSNIPNIFKYIVFAIILAGIIKAIIGFSDLDRSQKNMALGFIVMVLIAICAIYVLDIIGPSGLTME